MKRRVVLAAGSSLAGGMKSGPSALRWGSAMVDHERRRPAPTCCRTLEAADHFEQAHHPRLRARRPADRERHAALVPALVVNLAYASLSAPPFTGRLAIQAGNPAKGAGRYCKWLRCSERGDRPKPS